MRACGRLAAGFAMAAFALSARSPRLIKLQVSAVDEKGLPVSDLRPEDIHVFENGESQPIVFSRHWQDATSETPHVVTVLLNLLDPAVQPFQWEQTIHALKRFEAADDLYFYLLTNPSGVLLPVRGLPETAGQAAQPAAGWTDRLIPQLDAMRSLFRPPLPGSRKGGFDTDLTGAYAAAETLASKMSLLPGPKALVWIGREPLFVRSEDWGASASAHQMDDKMSHLLSVLDRADIRVYTARLTLPISSTDANDVVVRTDERPGLSDATSGRTYLDDIVKAVSQASSDSRQGYRIVYDSQTPDSVTKYHKIEVKTDRRGVHLYTKRGYDPQMIQDPDPTHREFAYTMVDALREAPGISLRATVARGARDPNLAHFQVHVDAADLLLLPDGKSYRGKLSLLFVSYPKDGRKMVSGDPIPISFNLSREQRDIALRSGLSFPADVGFDSSIRAVRVIVCDDLAQSAGSVIIPIAPAREPEH